MSTSLISRLIRALLFAVAIALLSLNIAGLVLPLRDPRLNEASPNIAPGDITLTGDQLQAALRRGDDTVAVYVERATSAVSRGMANYWESGDYNIHLPARENWLLWLAGKLMPPYSRWELLDHHKALERGVGLCSQHAIVLVGFLREEGITAQIAGLEEHVVTTVEIEPGRWVVADPDYGIVMPYSLDELRAQPDRVAPYYRRFNLEAWAMRMYAGPAYLVADGAVYNPSAWQIEQVTYVAIWAIPLGILVLLIGLTIRSSGALLQIPYTFGGAWLYSAGAKKTSTTSSSAIV